MLRRLPRLFACSLLACSLFACKENGNDYLQEGLRLLGEAERGDCMPNIERGQAVLDGRKVAECLDKTKAALEQLHKARELGVAGRQTDDLISKTEEEVQRLESMLAIVSRMQNER